MELTLDTQAQGKTHATSAPRVRLWTGRVLSALATLFMLFDSAGKLLRLDPVLKGTAELGYQTSAIVPIGLMLLGCVVLYLVPRTALLGAVLLTGYLGGAVASQMRVGNPLLSHTLFPVYFAALVWGGLYLRDGRVRALLAPRGP
jgi:hypothetical protein